MLAYIPLLAMAWMLGDLTPANPANVTIVHRPVISHGIAAPTHVATSSDPAACAQAFNTDASARSLCVYELRTAQDTLVTWQWSRSPCGHAICDKADRVVPYDNGTPFFAPLPIAQDAALFYNADLKAHRCFTLRAAILFTNPLRTSAGSNAVCRPIIFPHPWPSVQPRPSTPSPRPSATPIPAPTATPIGGRTSKLDIVSLIGPPVYVNRQPLTPQQTCALFTVTIKDGAQLVGSATSTWFSQEAGNVCIASFTSVPQGVPLSVVETAPGGVGPFSIAPQGWSNPTTVTASEPLNSITHNPWRQFVVGLPPTTVFDVILLVEVSVYQNNAELSYSQLCPLFGATITNGFSGLSSTGYTHWLSSSGANYCVVSFASVPLHVPFTLSAGYSASGPGGPFHISPLGGWSNPTTLTSSEPLNTYTRDPFRQFVVNP